MGKTVVFDGKMGMRKFGSAAPPFGKVACAVKSKPLIVYAGRILQRSERLISTVSIAGRFIGLQPNFL